MVQQNQSKTNGTNDLHKIIALDAVQKLLVGIKIKIENDLGQYREIVDALIQAQDKNGSQGVQRTYTVLKRANPWLAEIDQPESIYPPSHTFDQSELTSLDKFAYTDAGQAESLAFAYGGKQIRYVPGLHWLIRSGSIWRKDDRGAIYQYGLVVSRARQNAVFSRQVNEDDTKGIDKKVNDLRWAMRSESKAKLESAIDLASKNPDVVTLVDDLDQDKYLLGVKNGVVDLRTGQLSNGPDDLITKRSNIPYYPEATCPRWEKFLLEIFGGDKDLVDYVGRCIGYCLTGDTKEQCFWILHGTGQNGKSTFVNILTLLGGEYCANTPFNTFRLGKESNAGDDLARLRGMRIITSSEFGPVRINEERIKAITGGDPVTARFLYGSFFTFKPEFKLWLTSNHKPEIIGTDLGIWRRPRLIPFEQKFEGDKADKSLEPRLIAEMPGILAWAIRKCIDWQSMGLRMPPAVEQATAAYRTEMDLIGRFLDEICLVDKPHQTKAGDLYKAYKNWCEGNGIKAFNNVVFGQKLKERGFQSSGRTTKGFYWLGIGLENDGTLF
jgi:putative DNA primase/helicase